MDFEGSINYEQNETEFKRKEFWIFFQEDYTKVRYLNSCKHLSDLLQMAEQAQRAKAIARSLGIDQRNIKVKTQMTTADFSVLIKDAEDRFSKAALKGQKTLLFVYCGGYGVVDKQHYYCLNSDYQFLVPVDTEFKKLSKCASIVGLYDFIRQPIDIFPVDAFAECEDDKNDDN